MDDHATEYEAWVQCHRHLQEQLAAAAAASTNKGLQDDHEEEENFDENGQCPGANDDGFANLQGLLFAARVGRLAYLQCALMEQEQQQQQQEGMADRSSSGSSSIANNDNNTASAASLTELLEWTQSELDRDAAKENPNGLASSAALCGTTDTQEPSHNSSNLSDMCVTSIDIDAFFLEYPECEQPASTAYNDDDSVELSEDEDDGDEKVEDKRPKSSLSSRNDELSTNRPKSSTKDQDATSDVSSTRENRVNDAAAVIPPNPYQQNRTSKSCSNGADRVQTPPQTLHLHQQEAQLQSLPDDQSNNQFSYTPADTPPTGQAAMPGTFKGDSQVWNSHVPAAPSVISNLNNPYLEQAKQNNYQNQYHPQSGPYTTQRHQGNINHEDDWAKYQQFQTAREVDEEQSANNFPHNPYQQQPPSHAQRNGFNNNPYGMNPPSHESQYHTHAVDRSNEGTSALGGPPIRNSLKQKFQNPKRSNSLEQPKSSNGQERRNFGPSGKAAVVTAPPKGGGGQIRKAIPRPSSSSGQKNTKGNEEEELPEELQHLEKELVLKIQSEIMDNGESITFDHIAGLEGPKQTVQEVVCWPMKRPDLFVGLRSAPKGLLLYGPPGTGKTLIGKAIAHESSATFFSISSSSLTSKWIGEGEKLVRTLFAVAAYQEPSVVFIDEIDSLLTQRKATENEASRRIKTEFLVQLDGTGTSGQGRVLIIGATNRPQELDEAVRRRFVKRLYIPLPNEDDRRALFQNVIKQVDRHELTDADFDRLARKTKGYSGADLSSLCKEAAMEPLRIQVEELKKAGKSIGDADKDSVQPVSYKHFKAPLKRVKPSVSPDDLLQYEEWDKLYGTRTSPRDDDDNDSDSSGDK